MSFIIMKVVLLIGVLLSVAFVTLLERKILGCVQYRIGPNKVGFMGVFQPFADALKLITKEKMDFSLLNNLMYFIIPMVSLILMFLFWGVVSIECDSKFNSEYELVLVMLISSMGVYIIIFMGWSSNSKYALLGAYRGVSQSISYEVCFSFILLGLILFSGGFSFDKLLISQKDYGKFLWGFFLVFLIWMVVILAETNRTPFDLSEGESELVSGFNIEYGGVDFALLFIAEYGNILFMSWVSSKLFFGGLGLFLENLMIIVMIMLVVRGTLIRYRYDNLMMLTWKVILPFSILMVNLIFYFVIF